MNKTIEKACQDIMSKKKSIDDFTKQEQKQIFNLMFGEEFMKSNNKGKKKTYLEVKK
tara:strand:+ start:705 stop:875 length:171 start_codon:yes stop_codon:yes gene_type:complete